MQVLKLERNIFEEFGKIDFVEEKTKGDSVFRSISVDFFDGVEKATVEKRKYPYFYKYYLYFEDDFENNVSLREKTGAKFLIGFYQRFCPEYVKNPVFDEAEGMRPDLYFNMTVIPGESMQRYLPGEGAVEEEKSEKKDLQGYRALDGYHEFTEEEKKDIGGQLDALKNQFADQLKELEALMGKRGN